MLRLHIISLIIVSMFCGACKPKLQSPVRSLSDTTWTSEVFRTELGESLCTLEFTQTHCTVFIQPIDVDFRHTVGKLRYSFDDPTLTLALAEPFSAKTDAEMEMFPNPPENATLLTTLEGDGRSFYLEGIDHTGSLHFAKN